MTHTGTNNDYAAQTESVNPLYNMDDNELLSRFKLEDNTTDTYKTYLRELQYRLRRSHIVNWKAPERFIEPIEEQRL